MKKILVTTALLFSLSLSGCGVLKSLTVDEEGNITAVVTPPTKDK